MTIKLHTADHHLQQQLLQRMRGLSFPAFCQLARLLLYRSGYAGVQLLEPAADSDGRDGLLYDGLLAASHTDLATTLTLVRVKQAEGAPVSRRFVDQLRGAMLRVGAEHGLLLVTGCFSRFALEASKAPGLSSVRLVNGDELCSLLLARGLGVQAVDSNKKGRRHAKSPQREIDEAFFSHLEQRAAFGKHQPAAPDRPTGLT